MQVSDFFFFFFFFYSINNIITLLVLLLHQKQHISLQSKIFTRLDVTACSQDHYTIPVKFSQQNYSTQNKINIHNIKYDSNQNLSNKGKKNLCKLILQVSFSILIYIKKPIHPPKTVALISKITIQNLQPTFQNTVVLCKYKKLGTQIQVRQMFQKIVKLNNNNKMSNNPVKICNPVQFNFQFSSSVHSLIVCESITSNALVHNCRFPLLQFSHSISSTKRLFKYNYKIQTPSQFTRTNLGCAYCTFTCSQNCLIGF
eukprot:TRINITY_DN38386_c0_g1_i1.p1 TRINITY_DN38386_c0_g1~~TRINITY_DN38386_c0_g1_i1.p1  ORF type:complete len:269 (-),score=-23.30 TRINITY_DN38386_c0_g1_i1:39-809(-)